ANFVPGYGESTGERIVEHPDVSLIVFTGSRQVGLAINAKAAEVSTQGTPMVKRVIAEMGGKNSIIVDTDADLDEAVLGTVHSAFGFQGQKCSACSRVIVVETVHDTFVERLRESIKSLVVGPAEHPATNVGPVIDQEAQNKINAYIEAGKQEGTQIVSVDVSSMAETGFFVAPAAFSDIDSNAKIAQQEIFGPVLAIIKVKDLDEAIRVANDTEYGLTGGIFSRSPEVLQRVKRELMVGNIYLNRGITGALVGRQPFGGFKMSGIGSKAGGSDYLRQFVLPRTITENTMRRGFVPPESN
ncbi:MAG: aldehyde dehydrogenase family protein, partial [Planctomycetota bacterium]|nr:aldehyde dehydrogenase family protein [Planctomycetota bacterium]